MITVKHLKKQLDILRDDYEVNVYWNSSSCGIVIYEEIGSLIGTIDFNGESQEEVISTNQENDNETINSTD